VIRGLDKERASTAFTLLIDSKHSVRAMRDFWSRHLPDVGDLWPKGLKGSADQFMAAGKGPLRVICVESKSPP
jgi:hypothetical protein